MPYKPISLYKALYKRGPSRHDTYTINVNKSHWIIASKEIQATFQTPPKPFCLKEGCVCRDLKSVYIVLGSKETVRRGGRRKEGGGRRSRRKEESQKEPLKEEGG